jgi:predicted transposase YbfD/YdcC
MFNLAKESFQLFDQGESDIRVHTAEDEIDSGHGRIDKRLVHTMSADKLLPYIDTAWKGIESLARITHVEWKNGQESISYRFYITSLKAGSPTLILNSIRAHWLIENNLHWALDVCMGEDASRIRHRNGALNASWLRKLVLGILKNTSFDIPKLSIKSKQLLIASNPSCRIPMVLEAF